MDVKQKSTVLIVDDEPTIRNIMEGLLFQEGYDLAFAESGAEALTQVEKLAPDIILLDVMMPGMDGFEVCQRLKADKRWRHIPIILITALGDKEDLIRGFDAGADDFLRKPVDSLELRARVRSMLRIKKQYDELEATLRLREELTHMIVHDIRTPLTAIHGFSALLLMRDKLSPEDAKDVDKIQTQAHRLNSFLNDMLILAKMEAEKLILNRSMVDVNQLVQQVKKSYEVMAQSKKVKLIIDLPSESRNISLDANLFQRMLDNLISNALKFSPVEGTVTLRVEYPEAETSLQPPEPQIRIKVLDEGPGIAKLIKNLITDPDISFLLLVGAYRDNEVSESHPLKSVLESVKKAAVRFNDISLLSLNVPQINSVMSDVLRCEEDRSLVLAEMVHRKTEGNPFFIEEVVKALVEEDALDPSQAPRVFRDPALTYIPQSIRATIGRRLERVSPESARLLTQAAVVGRQFSLDLLLAITDLAEDVALRKRYSGARSDCRPLHRVVPGHAQALRIHGRRPLIVAYRYLLRHDLTLLCLPQSSLSTSPCDRLPGASSRRGAHPVSPDTPDRPSGPQARARAAPARVGSRERSPPRSM